MNNFDHAFKVIIGHEGGFTDDRRDRGNWTDGAFGENGGVLKGTKYGIASHVYPDLDIRNLTPADAKRIYKRDYWDRLGADDLPAPLALAAFDTAVNSGVGRARQFLAQTHDWREFLALRLRFLRGLEIWPTYGRGWTKRVETLRDQCAALEAAQPRPAPRVFLTHDTGRRDAWDGKATQYGGKAVDLDFITRLLALYPPPTPERRHGDLYITVADDGAIILRRA